MWIPNLSRLINRELASLCDELRAYPDEAQLWALPPGLPNSAGTIALHLIGNIRWYIGAQYGATGYVRDRPAEFARRDVPRAELIHEIEVAADEVTRVFAAFDEGLLETPFPQEVGGLRIPTGRFLQHLASHLAYHLGQVDYHRRAVTGNTVSVGTLPIAPIAL
jgi:uncharacterized damage-inducible protein DinB